MLNNSQEKQAEIGQKICDKLIEDEQRNNPLSNLIGGFMAILIGTTVTSIALQTLSDTFKPVKPVTSKNRKLFKLQKGSNKHGKKKESKSSQEFSRSWKRQRRMQTQVPYHKHL